MDYYVVDGIFPLWAILELQQGNKKKYFTKAKKHVERMLNKHSGFYNLILLLFGPFVR
jgi:hypothetical protein